MSSESDVEIHTALPKKTKKIKPKSPSVEMLKNSEPKKVSTKDMIHDALQVLHTRKGVSLYAIKKFVTEKYNVDIVKLNYLIKKSIKTDLESGVIIQTKGTGVSGSFKFAPKKKIEKPIKKKKIPTKKKMVEKIKKAKMDGEEIQKDVKKIVKKKKEMEKPTKNATKKEKVNKDPKKKEKEVKKVKNKMAKESQTPAKKRVAMMKRKSIGSIIKPPKMKPKAK